LNVQKEKLGPFENLPATNLQAKMKKIDNNGVKQGDEDDDEQHRE
jgi:hypothetical protein